MNQLPRDNVAIIAGTANPALANAVARSLGVIQGACDIGRFPDGEVSVSLTEPVRGREVFIFQPTAPPVDENFMELVALSDACRRASAARVIAVVPYFGYARSDKRHHPSEPIMASAVAHMLQSAGVDHLVTIDLHAAQIEGFFRIPVDSLSAVPVLCSELRGRLPEQTIVISPDEGRVKTATAYARRLGAPLGVLHKERVSGAETRIVKVVGDVRGKPCLIIDDMISTGGTIAAAVEALIEAGARPEITVAASHGLLLNAAREKLSHEAVREVLVTDTIALKEQWERLRIVSVAPLVAETIRRITTPCTDDPDIHRPKSNLC
jgi:ribose-phosphate pyrophosphokinase